MSSRRTTVMELRRWRHSHRPGRPASVDYAPGEASLDEAGAAELLTPVNATPASAADVFRVWSARAQETACAFLPDRSASIRMSVRPDTDPRARRASSRPDHFSLASGIRLTHERSGKNAQAVSLRPCRTTHETRRQRMLVWLDRRQQLGSPASSSLPSPSA